MINMIYHLNRVKSIYDEIMFGIPRTANNFQLISRINTIQNDKLLSNAKKHKKLTKLFSLLLITSTFGMTGSYNKGSSNFIDYADVLTSTGKKAEIELYSDHVKINNSFNFTFSERVDVLNFLVDFCNNKHLDINFDAKKLESEWYVHNVCYSLGINQNSTKNADLDFTDDYRWYVNFAVSVAELLYDLRSAVDSNSKNKEISIFQQKGPFF